MLYWIAVRDHAGHSICLILWFTIRALCGWVLSLTSTKFPPCCSTNGTIIDSKVSLYPWAIHCRASKQKARCGCYKRYLLKLTHQKRVPMGIYFFLSIDFRSFPDKNTTIWFVQLPSVERQYLHKLIVHILWCWAYVLDELHLTWGT